MGTPLGETRINRVAPRAPPIHRLPSSVETKIRQLSSHGVLSEHFFSLSHQPVAREYRAHKRPLAKLVEYFKVVGQASSYPPDALLASSPVYLSGDRLQTSAFFELLRLVLPAVWLRLTAWPSSPVAVTGPNVCSHGIADLGNRARSTSPLILR